MNHIEVLKQALEALKWCHGGEPCGTAEAIAVVEKALANVATNDTPKERVDEIQKQRHEQEPVATVVIESGNQEVTMSWWHEPALPVGTKLYTIPPQRTWAGLTTEQLATTDWSADFRAGALWAEAKLKQKNGYVAQETNS